MNVINSRLTWKPKLKKKKQRKKEKKKKEREEKKKENPQDQISVYPFELTNVGQMSSIEPVS